MWYLLVVILLVLFVYHKIIKSANYWKNRNIVHEPAWPIVGNMLQAVLRKKHTIEILTEIYQKYSDHRYVGFMQFTKPMLMIRDIELIKQLTIKDFDHFHDHMSFTSVDVDPLLSKTLITLNGNSWRQMRSTLSPVFTSSKMRIMYQLMSECAENFVGHFKGKEQIAVEMKDILSRFTVDVIATTAFGIQINSLEEPTNSFFTKSRSLNRGIIQFAKLILLSNFPIIAKVTGAQVFPKDVSNFFRTIVKDNISKREKDGIVRPDLIHLLMQVREGHLKHESDTNKTEGFAAVEESPSSQNTKQIKLTDDDIVAQAMLFFFAGFDTVSTASCFLAHELAVHPDIQQKLQHEIDNVQVEKDGKISYEKLLSMKYLDQVICETLRMWPPAFETDRQCTKNYILQASRSHEKEVILEKNDTVLIPIVVLHRDPQYFPEPERFDPERFSDENKSKIIPGSYMPFGAGPRNCIGSRFALLEIKTLFFHLLSKFDIVPVTGTQIPLRISPKEVNVLPENGFRLGFRPRKI